MILFRYLKKLLIELLGLVIYWLSFAFPRNKSIWIFGEWHGHGYRDNSKHLFEYLCSGNDELICVWVTKSRRIYNELKDSPHEVVYAYSLQGFKYCFFAKYAFVTHGARDVNQFAIGGAEMVNLTHGTPLKKIGKDAGYKRLGALTWVFDGFFSKLLAYRKKPSYIIAASEVAKIRFSSAFEVKEAVFSFGYPRWKPLLESRSYSVLEKISKNYRYVVLYAPTLRKNNHVSIDPFGFGGFQDFHTYIKDNEILLIVRPHPSMNFLEDYLGKNILHATVDNFQDINLIFPIADLLVTDYSSAMFDYAILERPIILLAPDADEYTNNDVGVYGDYYKDALGPVVTNWSEVLEHIKVGWDKTSQYDSCLIGVEHSKASPAIVDFFKRCDN